jgi:hypothetical protein
VELDIRGEMEAAAAELETNLEDGGDGQEAPPASEEIPAKPDAEPDGEKAADPPIADPPPADAPVTPKADEDELPLGGSIPVPRVRKILENARKKAAAEATAGYAGLDWAKGLTKDEVEAAVNLTRFANEQPTEFVRRAIERLRSDPDTTPEMQRILDSYSAKPAEKSEEGEKDVRPAPDVLLEDGRLVYSDAQQTKLLDWHERQLEAKFTAKLAPLEQKAKREDGLRAIEERATEVLKEVLTWPGMDKPENKKAVSEAMVKDKLAVDAAYRKVVLPKLTDTKAIEDRVRKQVLSELKTKARAGSVNPQPTGGEPQDFKKMTVRQIIEATAAELGDEAE